MWHETDVLDMQRCTVGDLDGQEECLRLAAWEWRPDSEDHPLFLCNFHADPLM